MRACLCFCLLSLAATVLAAADAHGTAVVRGKLQVRDGQPAIVETDDHKHVVLDGDLTTRKVLNDSRLNGFQVEAHGIYTAPDRFRINASHTHPFLVRQEGRLKLVSYWCDICSIRAYTPGPCVCCQKDTALELRDPDQP